MKSSETLGTSFLRAAEEDGLGVTFWTGLGRHRKVTYHEMVGRASRVAGRLISLGLKPGDRMGIVLPTGPDFYDAFFGAVFAGVVPCAMYPPVRLGRIDEWKNRTSLMMTEAEVQIVLTDRRLLPLVSVPGQSAGVLHGVQTVEWCLKSDPVDPRLQSPQSLAAVQFSSGSTGRPKPVALTHRNMVQNCQAIMSTFPRDVEVHSGVSWLPLYHDMGLIGCLLTAIMAKGPLTLINPERFIARPISWLEALTESKATISVAPNFAFGLCAERIEEKQLAGLDLSSWSVALCGAEPVHPKTLTRFSERFASVGFRSTALTPVYGLAEATLGVTFAPLEQERRTIRVDPLSLEVEGRVQLAEDGLPLSSLGGPLPGTRIEIRNEHKEKVAPGQVGQVWIQGDGVMAGYLNQPDATAAVLQDGWLDTGDRGFIEGGELFLCGRAKDVIILRGRNHDPSVIEQGLDGVEGLRTGCWAAVSLPVEDGDSEALFLLVETRGGDEETIVSGCQEAVQEHSGLAVAGVLLLESGTLPRTSSGKIRRSEARLRLLQGRLLPPKKMTALGIATEFAKGWLTRWLPRPKED
ncbi:MAG: AMP-dependent synthetase [Myxococcales bacterium]|nr:AMP-dependent synthetase [Myxococcales bacterium]